MERKLPTGLLALFLEAATDDDDDGIYPALSGNYDAPEGGETSTSSGPPPCFCVCSAMSSRPMIRSWKMLGDMQLGIIICEKDC